MFTPHETDRHEVSPVNLTMSRRGWLQALGAGAVFGGAAAARAAESPGRLASAGKRKIPTAHLLDRRVVFAHNERYVWNGCGAIAASKNALVMSWYTGGPEEFHPLDRVVWSRSLDRGNTWSEPKLTADPPGDPRAADPMLWHDANGVIHSTYGVSNTFEGPGKWQFFHQSCADPAADELTWSEPKRIDPAIPRDFGETFHCNTKPIELDNGELLVPIAVRTRPHPKPQHWEYRANGALIWSPDRTEWQVFRNRKEFPQSPYTDDRSMWLWECTAFQRDDGTVAMYFRNSWGVLHASYSTDRGRTWSDYEPTVLVNPSARTHVRKLPSGPVICITNASMTSRRFLSMYISYDDGRHFTRLVILEGVEDPVMYPDADLDPDGHTLHIFYENRKDIFYAPLDLRQVL